MKVSVLFATYNRDDILRVSLAAYRELNLNDIELELIIVDNAVSKSTQYIIEQESLPITYIGCQKPGKNSAINKGLKVVTGDYVILTDDDAVPDVDWIYNYKKGFERYPNIEIFGGSIIPVVTNWPTWIDLSDRNIKSAYVIRTLSKKDCDISPPSIWGPNMAIKKSIFSSGITFNENIGPNGSDYIMGSETEFLRRLEKLNYPAKYLADVIVGHQIRDEQLTLDWLKARAFRAGKGIAHYKIGHDKYSENLVYIFDVPRYMLVEYIKFSIALFFMRPFIDKKKYTSLIYENNMRKGELSFLKRIALQ
jgi:glycosyltransferase involved in cell wall biosynthesis